MILLYNAKLVQFYARFNVHLHFIRCVADFFDLPRMGSLEESEATMFTGPNTIAIKLGDYLQGSRPKARLV